MPFDKLDHEQQKQFMEDVVFAPLKKAFQDHDPKRFAKFQCETCHGPSAAKDEFDMPNPDLPKLNFSDMTKWKPADVDWMTNVVKPTMAKLLRLPEMSRDNPKGFGCENCHTETGGS